MKPTKLTKKIKNLINPPANYQVTVDLETLWEANQVFRNKQRLKAARNEARRQLQLAISKFGLVMYLSRQQKNGMR